MQDIFQRGMCVCVLCSQCTGHRVDDVTVAAPRATRILRFHTFQHHLFSSFFCNLWRFYLLNFVEIQPANANELEKKKKRIKPGNSSV